MPRNANGTYTLVSGNPVTTGSVITSDWANTTMTDLANGLTDSLSRSGNGGMLVVLKKIDGSKVNPSDTFTNDLNTGVYLEQAGEMRVVAAGIDRMRWSDTNVDIWDDASSTWGEVFNAKDSNVTSQDVIDFVTAGLEGGIGEALPAEDALDLDGIVITCFKYVTNAVNAPAGFTDVLVTTVYTAESTGRAVQNCSNPASATPIFYTRELVDGTWQNWVEVWQDAGSGITAAEATVIVGDADTGNIGKTDVTAFVGDLDNLKTNGFYWASSAQTNMPIVENGTILVNMLSGTVGTQTFTSTASDAVYARRIAAGTWEAWFAVGAGGGGGTLQEVYDLSSPPEILTSVAEGAVVLRRGSASENDSVLEVQQNNATKGFTVNGWGNVYTSRLDTPTVDVTTELLVGLMKPQTSGDIIHRTLSGSFGGFKFLKSNGLTNWYLRWDSSGFGFQNGSNVWALKVLDDDSGGELMGNWTTQGDQYIEGVNYVDNDATSGSFKDVFVVRNTADVNETNAIRSSIDDAGADCGFSFEVSDGGGAATRTQVLALTKDEATYAVPLRSVGTFQLTMPLNNSSLSVGYEAGLSATGTQNICVGFWTGKVMTTGIQNTFMGYKAGQAVTSSNGNTLIGSEAGAAITTGAGNVALGVNTLKSITNVFECVAIGQDAMINSTNKGTAVGAYALQNNTATANVAVGHSAGKAVTSGSGNVLIGDNAGTSITTASSCTAVGWQALDSNLTGTYNVAIGASSFSALDAATGNTAVGRNADSTKTGGNWCTTLGYGALSSTTTASGEFTLGNSSITNLRCADTTISALSDARDKTEVESCPIGLDYINSLNPVQFKWDYRAEHTVDGVVPAKQGTREIGFIAQELKESQDSFGADALNSYQHYPAEETAAPSSQNLDIMEASYGKLLPVMVKAMQEMSAKLDAALERISELEN